LSAQVALDKRLTTIARNVANMNTVGYRADHVSFESLVSRRTDRPVAFTSTGNTFISREVGALIKTDNPLDVAVQGDAWLAIQTPAGTAYTRDGRMRMTENGDWSLSMAILSWMRAIPVWSSIPTPGRR
jgi:flagellar basal-body rod protein FlgF